MTISQDENFIDKVPFVFIQKEKIDVDAYNNLHLGSEDPPIEVPYTTVGQTAGQKMIKKNKKLDETESE